MVVHTHSHLPARPPARPLAFFEGLAGSEADIDAIFELEEEFENESALDLTDAGPIPPVDFRHRRPSQPARPRGPSSGSISNSPSPLQDSSPSSPARKPESSSPAPLSPPPLSHIALPRTRVNSILSMAQSAPSPLAQVFQPLMMHEAASAASAAAAAAADPPAEDQKGGGGGGAEDGQNAPFPKMSSSPPAMSYGGPAVRRRLSSQQQQQQHRRDGSLPQQAGLGLGLRRFPPAAISSPPQTSAVFESPDEHDTDGLAAEDDGAKTPGAEGGKGRSGSVGERRRGGGGGPLETAGQIEEGGGGFGELEKRFDRVESRQKRIEDLLVHLTTSLRR
ncbi:hypothetical protein PHLCEN_2v2432 [Hermanssonia centrifuga]|uniref:Uncharacterized protein n=1 Tax=Hermanssonia centrifuga TaxID=98765 RepID=A0A2R6RLY9_9APHY|nr:hypothetical protein PHLCEN_2v2432 [Hermanssonia centrifuga]